MHTKFKVSKLSERVAVLVDIFCVWRVVLCGVVFLTK